MGLGKKDKKSIALTTQKKEVGRSKSCKIQNCEEKSCVGCSWNKD